MSNEILSVLEYMEKEKGISRADMIETIIGAIKHAASKSINAGQELKISIDPRTGKLESSTLLTVVDSVSDPLREIHINKASAYASNPQLGDIVERPGNAAELGRIAAQAARQAIMQRVRQFEKERIFDEFKDQIGNIVTGVVRRRERGDIVVELGKAEATLSARERSPGEDFAAGDRIRCLLLDIEATPRGPEIILSRANPNFVKRMLELEVAEISDGTVFIAALVREAGSRTKIAVDTRDPKVDPVGACVGSRGSRVRSIVKELGTEKVDIIRWYPDPVQMLAEAIKPARAYNIKKDEAKRLITFEVDEEHLSTAIGRRGQNAKLTSRILGWHLDIKKQERRDTTFETRKEKAVTGLSNIPGINPSLAERLVKKGFTTLEVLSTVSAEDLVGEGFEPAEAVMIVDLVASARGNAS
ncbi:MAG: transcription termination factor NusA [Puniceicoccales bacterium]|jgi:N utilization substance protein A|nr:transcription termination factor NusA [Puniceicoccales bacterium]